LCCGREVGRDVMFTVWAFELCALQTTWRHAQYKHPVCTCVVGLGLAGNWQSCIPNLYWIGWWIVILGSVLTHSHTGIVTCSCLRPYVAHQCVICPLLSRPYTKQYCVSCCRLSLGRYTVFLAEFNSCHVMVIRVRIAYLAPWVP